MLLVSADFDLERVPAVQQDSRTYAIRTARRQNMPRSQQSSSQTQVSLYVMGMTMKLSTVGEEGEYYHSAEVVGCDVVSISSEGAV